MYISAVAQRGRHAELYPFQGHVHGIRAICAHEGWGGLTKGTMPRVTAEALRVVFSQASRRAGASYSAAVSPDARGEGRRRGSSSPGREDGGWALPGKEMARLVVADGLICLLIAASTHPLVTRNQHRTAARVRVCVWQQA